MVGIRDEKPLELDSPEEEVDDPWLSTRTMLHSANGIHNKYHEDLTALLTSCLRTIPRSRSMQ